MQPHVFVVMPFGMKEAGPVSKGKYKSKVNEPISVNFDEVYELLIAPALSKADCFSFRADKEKGAGDIRTDMFFELVTADVIVADISILNPNVFYELGVRHGVRPRGVIMIHGGWSRRPFDVAPDRTFDYNGKLFEQPKKQRDNIWKEMLEGEVEKLTRIFKGALEVDEQTIGSPVFKELVGLKPADWSNIKTARAEYFGQIFVDWKSRVEVAKLNGLPGDIMTLADDAPTRFHRTQLLWEAALSLISMHRFTAAEKALNDLLNIEPSNLNALTQLGLVLGRLNRVNEAKVHMARVADQFAGNPEAQGILGRVYKDLWRSGWDKEESNLQQRQQDAVSSSPYAESSIRSYNNALRLHLDSYYNGINVISLSKVLQYLKTTTGRKPVDPNINDLKDLIVVVRMAAQIALDAASEKNNHNEVIWAKATLAEIELVAGKSERAIEYYEQAANTPEVTYFQVDSMLTQVLLFQRLGFNEEVVGAILQILENRLKRLNNPKPTFKNVFLCSGHMVDSPKRAKPRFPEKKVDVVRDRLADQLDEWKIGNGDLAICGGARGADILFAELCAKKEAEVWMFIALDEPEFLKESVRLQESKWEDRFYDLKSNPKVKVFFQNERLKAPPMDASPFARTNLWMINTALAETKNSDSLFAILVWDELPTGDGPGGTSDFATKVRRLGGRLSIINPTKLNSK